MNIDVKQLDVSPLLVFAVAGRLGAGCSFVKDCLQHSLSSYGYRTDVIRVTEIIKDMRAAAGGAPKKQTAGARITWMQEQGTALRTAHGNKVFAEQCIARIAERDSEADILSKRKRYAFIIDSLKRPEEVELLRNIFGKAFYLVGVLASDSTRRERLRERKDLKPDEFDSLSETDCGRGAGSGPHGQRTAETVVLADYFFRNDYATKDAIQGESDRLMKLIFSVGIESPTVDEVGMHGAFQAAARSACLSRQVGAAIYSKDGAHLSDGHNDVPQFGGGLYGDGENDRRCHALGGKCYNDDEKRIIVDELMSALAQAGISDDPDGVARRIIESSRIKQLSEFSRAVHAEMEAIIGVARRGAPGIVGSTLYTTTYPCHNCAKHIIDAGIARVVFLEPYEKSLARKLHSDSINDSASAIQPKKVQFDFYGGVAPSRYDELFRSGIPRKKDGRFLDRDRDRKVQMPSGAQETKWLDGRIKKVLSDRTTTGKMRARVALKVIKKPIVN